MHKQEKSEQADDASLFLNVSLFVYGLLCTAGGLFLAKEAYDSLFESDSVWIFAAITALSLAIFFWGILLIASGIFPNNRRLQSVVEMLDGSNEIGCLSVFLAFPVFLLVRLLRGLSSSNDRS